jgi:hypothetical protein
MRPRHRIDAGADIGRKRRGLSRGHIDMNGHVLRRGRQPALGGVAQFLERMQPLFVGVDQQDKNGAGRSTASSASVIIPSLPFLVRVQVS